MIGKQGSRLLGARLAEDRYVLVTLVVWLQFSQKKADSEIRWAVLNVTSILRRYETAHQRLADAMAKNKSVAECIAVIEDAIPSDALSPAMASS